MAATLSPSVNQFQNFKHVGYKYAIFVVECKQNNKIHLLEYKRAEECNTYNEKLYRTHEIQYIWSGWFQLYAMHIMYV